MTAAPGGPRPAGRPPDISNQNANGVFPITGSADWADTPHYTRLEQGRSRTASPEVIDALAGALRLDGAEREHLHTLARPAPARRRRRPRPQRVDPATWRLLDTLETAFRPAFVLGAASTSSPTTGSPDG